MTDLTTFDFAVRLAAGVGCGALIGIERQWRARMAGLRTNALVAAGATLFVLYSEAVGDPGSPTRVASYVVSGTGFLGAGVILREGGGVRGLNTAATLWCSAAVGVLAASGRLGLCLIGTVVVIAVHLLLRPAGRLIDRVPQRDPDHEGVPATVHLVCGRADESHVRALSLPGPGRRRARAHRAAGAPRRRRHDGGAGCGLPRGRSCARPEAGHGPTVPGTGSPGPAPAPGRHLPGPGAGDGGGMSGLDARYARLAVQRAARQLAEDAPKLAAGSAGAYRLGLATRTAGLRRAALDAWLVGIPEDVIASDGCLPRAVVRRWITARFSPGPSSAPARSSAPSSPASSA
ncbi:MgtC/SapB family protein [Streptomyces sp. NPDC094038]|uniref:MgtC/SapB family protein n=1 Tax=Streptomyces sp. NPDC094038 TaxID=3366055 RepID=UPI0037F4126C